MTRHRMWFAEGELSPVRRHASEVREMLRRTAEPPTVDLFPRSDGPGSSQDLPQFAAMGTRLPTQPMDLDDSSWAWSRRMLRTPGACIDGDPIRYRALPAEDPDAFEYYSPDFHERPVCVRGDVPGEPRLFVHNILAQFGLRGIRIEADPMPAVYRGTGLGGSNLAHAGALILASALSGADLSLGQIYVVATLIENYFGVHDRGNGHLDFGVSLTGGQETLTAFQGGFWDNVHTPHHHGPFSVVSRELVSPDRYAEVESHLALINVGQRRSGGVTSSTVNREWMAAWLTKEGPSLHLHKPLLAYDAAEALRTGDWESYCAAVASYRELRARLCSGYLAGQEDLAVLCRDHEAEYFPLGGGAGTCLVACSDAEALASILDVIEKTQDPQTGRAALRFRVRADGLALHGFEETGLELPVGPREL